MIFLSVVLLMIGYPLWWFVRQSLNHGVVDRDGYAEVDLKWLSDFEMEQKAATDQDIPPDRRKLDGRTVMLIGEVYQPRSIGGNQSAFQLCYSIQKCCFSGPTKIQHLVQCRYPRGMDFGTGAAVKVMGKLQVGVQRDGETIGSVYRLDVTGIKEVR